MSGSQSTEPPAKGKDWAAAVFLVEAAALMIALLMPITPSKTGSTWSPADFFWEEPSYLQEVAVGFVTMNLLIAVIGLGFWITSKLRSVRMHIK